MGKNEFCHLDDEHQSNVFCLSLSLWHHNSVLSSRGVRELGDIRMTVRWGCSLSFHWLTAFPQSLFKAHPVVGNATTWWSCLTRMDQMPEPWRPAQDLIVLDDREADISQNTLLLSFPSAVIQDGCHQTLIPPLYSAPPPSTVLGLILSAFLARNHLPSLLQPSQLLLLSIQINAYMFLFPKHRISVSRLPTLHHPVHSPIALCLQTPTPPPVQFLFISQCIPSWGEEPCRRSTMTVCLSCLFSCHSWHALQCLNPPLCIDCQAWSTRRTQSRSCI